MTRVFAFLKRTVASWLPALVATLIVCASVGNADPWAPYGLFVTGAATTDAGCTDLGGGLNVLSNTLLCISPTQLEDLTLSGAGTGLNVTTNALVGGTLGVTGTLTSGVQNGSGTLTIQNVAPLILQAGAAADATTFAATAVGSISTTVALLALTPAAGCTGTNLSLSVVSGSAGFAVACSGKTLAKAGMTVTGGTLAFTGNNIQGTSTAAGLGQALMGNANPDANMAGGAFVVGSGGMYEDSHTCTVSMSNASPSLGGAAATDFACFLNASAGSATATQYQVTFPTEAGIRTNLPFCFVQQVAGVTVTSLCSVSAANPMVATINFFVGSVATAPTTTGRFNIWLVANGP